MQKSNKNEPKLPHKKDLPFSLQKLSQKPSIINRRIAMKDQIQNWHLLM